MQRMLLQARPFPAAFEEHTLACLATGASAEKVRDLIRLTANFLLPNEKFDLPNLDWFRRQRTRLGLTSEFYTYIEIARAKEILMLGFDETKMRLRSTCNVWVLYINKDGRKETRQFECMKTLIGGTAQEVADHVVLQFERAQAHVDRLRDELSKGGFDPDELVPVVDGGVNMHKVRSLMHDTCNTANASAKKMKDAANDAGKAHFGAAVWENMPEERTMVLDYLCGNHTRGLPIDAWNRLHDAYLTEKLGSQLKLAEENGASRLERSGKSLVFSICKLCHEGFGAYAKGDGEAFHGLMVGFFDEWSGQTTGRAALSKRQDGVLEACPYVHCIVLAILTHVNTGRYLDPNILRDSVYIRLQLLPYQAYIHVGAIAWQQIFQELRAMTNSNEVDLNPLELNDRYDDLYKVGELLQGPQAPAYSQVIV